MKFHELQTTKTKNSKRVGRGIAAGRGKTAGRGTKGQKSRTGSSKKPGFEGGQNPLMQRLPKLRGFRSFKVTPETVYTGDLEVFANKKVTTKELAEAGIISSPYVSAKLVVRGELTKKVTVELQSASAAAIEVVEKAGGSFTKVARSGRDKTSEKKIAKAEAKAKK
jgi:large subunit ribosomal protein L15